MNALKRLQIEYNGICGIIEDYTDDPNIVQQLISGMTIIFMKFLVMNLSLILIPIKRICN